MLYAVRWSIWHLHRHVPGCMLFALHVPRTRLDEPMADREQALGRTMVAEELDGLNVHARPAHCGVTGHTERCRSPMRPLQWAAAYGCCTIGWRPLSAGCVHVACAV